MKIKDNSLVNYDDESIEKQEKEIFKTALFVFVFFLVICVVFTIVFPDVYPLIIGLCTGSILSVAMFYFLNKYIKETYYGDLRKTISRLHMIFSFIYILVFFAMYLIFKSVYGVIGSLAGFLLIKAAIILWNIKKK